jgi:Membrane-fusion protein
VLDVARVAQESEFRSLRRSFRVRVSLDASDPDRMRPGMSARVEIEARRLADVLVAPRAALDLSRETAFARTDDGAVEVRLGPCNSQECVVEGGLPEGARLRRRS